jgi:hypothetical protein
MAWKMGLVGRSTVIGARKIAPWLFLPEVAKPFSSLERAKMEY